MLFSPDILIIMGKVTNSHRAYYYENNFETETISQKYRWYIHKKAIKRETNATAKYTIRFLRDILKPLYNNKIYEATIINEESYTC
jgi:hypothetical protein